jgi:hypothetical protein
MESIRVWYPLHAASVGQWPAHAPRAQDVRGVAGPAPGPFHQHPFTRRESSKKVVKIEFATLAKGPTGAKQICRSEEAENLAAASGPHGEGIIGPLLETASCHLRRAAGRSRATTPGPPVCIDRCSAPVRAPASLIVSSCGLPSVLTLSPLSVKSGQPQHDPFLQTRAALGHSPATNRVLVDVFVGIDSPLCELALLAALSWGAHPGF